MKITKIKVDNNDSITNEEYFLLVQLVKKLVQDKKLADDLIQEVALYFIELNPTKKADLRQRKLVKPWFIRTILNQDRSSNSYFFRNYKNQPKVDIDTVQEPTSEEYVQTEQEVNLDLIKDWIENLFPSDKNIIKNYFEGGMTIMGIAAKYDIDKNHVVSTINRIKNSFYRRILWRQIPKQNLIISLQENLAPMIGRKRLKAEERQLILDAHNFLTGSMHTAFFDKELCALLLKSLIQKLKL